MPLCLDTDRLDQHLTINPAVVSRLVDTARLHPSDTALDIGAGTGLITRVIARSGCATIAIELDRQFAPYLEPLDGRDRISICWSDFRAVLPRDVTSVVANPPFGATEHLVSWFARLPRLRHISLIVGSRFARTAIAVPGSAQYTRLTLHVQAAFNARIHAPVTRTDFHPVARRDAAIVTLTPVPPSPLIKALDVAIHRNAGMPLRRVVLELRDRGLIGDDVPELLSPYWHKRLQELTNDEISRTVFTLSGAAR